MNPWLTRAGSFPVVRSECPHPNEDVDLHAPAAGVLHTTEGSWDGAMGVFHQHYAPHFLVGNKRIAQLVPLGKMSTALEHPSGYPETNRVARAQIEVVGFSQDTPYQFDTGTLDALSSLLAVLSKEAQIPLSRPWPDLMPPLPWATRSFVRRQSKWGHVAGWYGHVDIPGNTHWDPGAYKWTGLLTAAKSKANSTPKYHIKLVDEAGKEYVWDNNLYPGKTLHEFGVVAHKIRQGWIERQ